MELVSLVVSRDVEIFADGVCTQSGREKTMFVLGGRRPDSEWLADFAKKNTPRIWAIDSGAVPCRSAGILPLEIIGDRDSAPIGDWEWALCSGAREHLYGRDKDRTDFQLALELFVQNSKYKITSEATLILTGCFGGSLDHLISILNTFALSYQSSVFFRLMIDDVEGIFFIYPGGNARLKFTRKPNAVSLLPMTDLCGGVSISGVKWPLENVSIDRKFPWTVSNEVRPDKDGKYNVLAGCKEGIAALSWRF
jgi:thiamine pyrophosphokinase